ncbi:TRAP transporter large permease [Rhodospirillum sp. A1_3_36]|uniref:TRAP transporter large permease n=1 Tax=Rhodospirillum sp. A1_3_36 TaxID=3391666 RepID=UPI0039A62C2B
MITAILFVLFMAMGMPIVFILALSTVAFIAESGVWPLFDTVPLQLYGSLDKSGYLAIPMYMLVGELMNRGGITTRLIGMADLFVGRFNGGLAYVNLLTNAFASSILGSATAQIAVMSRTIVPAMNERGYRPGFSTALTIAAGMLGPVIPPSMLMIIYGVVAYQSVAALFIAGVMPGLLLTLGFALTIWGIGLFAPYADQGARLEGRSAFKAFLSGLLPSLIPLVIILGVITGATTPTESGATAAVLALVLGLFVYKAFRLRDLPEILLGVGMNTAFIVSLIGLATVFGWVLSFESVPDIMAETIEAWAGSPAMFLLLVNLLILALGMILDGIGVMIVIVPILLPVAERFGIDPIHFGVVVAISTLLGLVTPPVGPGLFVAMEATGLKMRQILPPLLPFLATMLICLVVINVFPVLSTWLPAILGL